MSNIPLGKQAVAWILAAPEGEKRTQQQAADKFGITQTVISLTMKRYVAEGFRPDGRRSKVVK